MKTNVGKPAYKRYKQLQRAVRMHRCERCNELFVCQPCMQVMDRSNRRNRKIFGHDSAPDIALYSFGHFPQRQVPWICEDCQKQQKKPA